MTHRSKRMNGSDLLVNSSQDTIALADAVESRFIEVCNLFLRVHGMELQIPDALRPDMIRWRKMRLRHKAGDFRNSVSEVKSTRSIAQWIVNLNGKMRGQKPKVIEWRDD